MPYTVIAIVKFIWQYNLTSISIENGTHTETKIRNR
jgi:hypothetical protein